MGITPESKIPAVGIRRIGARTIDALWRAIGNICSLYSDHECWNYLRDAGYASD